MMVSFRRKTMKASSDDDPNMEYYGGESNYRPRGAAESSNGYPADAYPTPNGYPNDEHMHDSNSMSSPRGQKSKKSIKMPSIKRPTRSISSPSLNRQSSSASHHGGSSSDSFSARRSGRASRVPSDGDSWYENLAVVEIPPTDGMGGGSSRNAMEGGNPLPAGRLVIRSYFQSKNTGQRVWDEPPSGASNVKYASEEARKMAEMQMKDLQVEVWRPSSGSDEGYYANGGYEEDYGMEGEGDAGSVKSTGRRGRRGLLGRRSKSTNSVHQGASETRSLPGDTKRRTRMSYRKNSQTAKLSNGGKKKKGRRRGSGGGAHYENGDYDHDMQMAIVMSMAGTDGRPIDMEQGPPNPPVPTTVNAENRISRKEPEEDVAMAMAKALSLSESAPPNGTRHAAAPTTHEDSIVKQTLERSRIEAEQQRSNFAPNVAPAPAPTPAPAPAPPPIIDLLGGMMPPAPAPAPVPAPAPAPAPVAVNPPQQQQQQVPPPDTHHSPVRNHQVQSFHSSLPNIPPSPSFDQLNNSSHSHKSAYDQLDNSAHSLNSWSGAPVASPTPTHPIISPPIQQYQQHQNPAPYYVGDPASPSPPVQHKRFSLSRSKSGKNSKQQQDTGGPASAPLGVGYEDTPYESPSAITRQRKMMQEEEEGQSPSPGLKSRLIRSSSKKSLQQHQQQQVPPPPPLVSGMDDGRSVTPKKSRSFRRRGSSGSLGNGGGNGGRGPSVTSPKIVKTLRQRSVGGGSQRSLGSKGGGGGGEGGSSRSLGRKLRGGGGGGNKNDGDMGDAALMAGLL